MPTNNNHHPGWQAESIQFVWEIIKIHLGNNTFGKSFKNKKSAGSSASALVVSLGVKTKNSKKISVQLLRS
jgi:hypothetical protein